MLVHLALGGALVVSFFSILSSIRQRKKESFLAEDIWGMFIPALSDHDNQTIVTIYLSFSFLNNADRRNMIEMGVVDLKKAGWLLLQSISKKYTIFACGPWHCSYIFRFTAYPVQYILSMLGHVMIFLMSQTCDPSLSTFILHFNDWTVHSFLIVTILWHSFPPTKLLDRNDRRDFFEKRNKWFILSPSLFYSGPTMCNYSVAYIHVLCILYYCGWQYGSHVSREGLSQKVDCGTLQRTASMISTYQLLIQTFALLESCRRTPHAVGTALLCFHRTIHL